MGAGVHWTFVCAAPTAAKWEQRGREKLELGEFENLIGLEYQSAVILNWKAVGVSEFAERSGFKSSGGLCPSMVSTY